MPINGCISEFELYLESQDKSDYSSREDTRRFLEVLGNSCGLDTDSSKSVEQFINKIKRSEDNHRRTASLLFFRYMHFDGLIPDKSIFAGIEHSLVELCKSSAPDVYRILKIDHKMQSFDSYARLRSFHTKLIDDMNVFKGVNPNFTSILANQQSILRSISNKVNKPYLWLFCTENMFSAVNEIFSSIEELSNGSSDRVSLKLVELRKRLDEESELCEKYNSFFINDYWLPFLSACKQALEKHHLDSIERLKCELGFNNRAPNLAEKTYALHEIGKELIVNIPIENFGPGIAVDVTVEIDDSESSCITFNSYYELGDLSVSQHYLSLTGIVIESCSSAIFEIEINYRDANEGKIKVLKERCVISAQNPDIDWTSLSIQSPYSTEVAEGAEFVGRYTAVSSLQSRCLKDKMQSSYIFGQKRVGKTSLAKAALKSLQENEHIETHYIEWGEVASQSSESSLDMLGRNIWEFLNSFVRGSNNVELPSFAGTLAPLNTLATQLLRSEPLKKFVFVIDEFDEIHSELYQPGPIADTFFANIRTLASKLNIAFILVGGENMPFIINVQGDQLNKFVAESLDFFPREDVFVDYKELVVRPVNGAINWKDETIGVLFDLTFGHPYYTKLVCAEAFEKAVSSRDADITRRDLTKSVSYLAENLDINSFSHLWMDGIQKKAVDNSEAIIRVRKSVLVALADCIRDSVDADFSSLVDRIKSHEIADIKVNTVLADFVRRNVLKNENGLYGFVVPLFESWLLKKGSDRIGPDFYNDSDIAALDNRIQELKVKDTEIESVVSNWRPYRGREITSQHVRAWLEQTQEVDEQRYLFTVLEGLKFYPEIEIRDKLRTMHESVKSEFPEYVEKRKNQKRNDLFVVYIDGEGKSGQRIAQRYMDENRIPVNNMCSSSEFSKKAEGFESSNDITINGVIIVDDFIGTGRTMESLLEEYFEQNNTFIQDRSLAIVVVTVAATSDGLLRLDKLQSKYDEISFSVRYGDVVDNRMCFGKDSDMWKSKSEMSSAKIYLEQVGKKLSKKLPLGFENQGLAIVFTDSCPNNCLPVLHVNSDKASFPWKPLFPRSKNG